MLWLEFFLNVSAVGVISFIKLTEGGSIPSISLISCNDSESE